MTYDIPPQHVIQSEQLRVERELSFILIFDFSILHTERSEVAGKVRSSKITDFFRQRQKNMLL